MGAVTFLENVVVPKLLKNTAALANINFSTYSTQNNLTQITKVKKIKPFEEKK
jgi:hypothetical protein